MADFLRISPWQANDVRDVLRHYQVAHLLAAATKTKAPQVIYVSIDDSLGEKDKARHIQVVDWHHDHRESTSKPRYKNAFCYLVCTLRIGELTATIDLRLYLRQNGSPPESAAEKKESVSVFRASTVWRVPY
ncbi:MAG: hypothetical protein IPG51_18335 [Chloroflexi bacterium]|nr:hypothetical protein [Chloroflexota bacterium]